MPFDPGSRLGPYEIIGPLGAGGMGEVYRARDIRLDRTVAIKILSGALAADSDARRRFEQEARAIAALNDPHICTIHDVGRHGDSDFLVLEHLEGETLADRLRRSGALPVDEAVAVATQTAEALDRAHRAGIAHRDLKPGNVMLVRRAGAAGPDVKLLDFGLAARTLASRPQGLEQSLAATAAPSMVATQPPTGNVSGGFAGTVQYMSPEQLDGDPGDHRVDIFAFGCVLYEMVAGRKAFEAGSAMTAIAAIMNTDPAPVPALQGEPLLDHLVRRCLEKDRERRWQNVGDVAGELRWIATRPVPTVAAPTPRAGGLGRAGTVALALTLVVVIALLAAGVRAWLGVTSAGEAQAFRLEVNTPPTDDPSMALSPDGTRLAFVANRDRVPLLWVRALDALENRPLPGTEGASFPFWSPDGRSLAFFADDQLKRVEVTGGGAPLVIAPARNGRGGSWNRDGVIVFAPGLSSPVMKVPAQGGTVEPVTEVNETTGPDHRWPQFLPDGKRFLFSSTLGTPETRGVFLGSLDKTPPIRVLAAAGVGRFAAPDRLLATRQGALQAYRFDPVSGAVEGEPEIVAQGYAGGAGAMATSDTGILAYRSGTAQRRQLVWVDRAGTELGRVGDPTADDLASPELDRGEQSVAVFSHRSGENDIWVIELGRNLIRRITDGPPADAHPLWDPDGQHVVYNGPRTSGGPSRQATGGGPPEPLLPAGVRGMALAWSSDRQWLLLRRDEPATGSDLVAVSATAEPREVAIAQTTADETEGQFSPDGRWVATVSTENGQPEVFLQSFPAGDRRAQISTAGGAQVRWSSRGDEIFYVAPGGMMMGVAVDLRGAAPVVKPPVRLFQAYLATGTNVIGNKAQYAVARDGRFLLNAALESPSAPIVLFVNWMKPAGN